VRNHLKVAASVTNAKAFLEVQKEFGSFDKYIRGFIGGKTLKNKWKSMDQVPATTKEFDPMSKDLKKHGFKFVGLTICFSFMQAKAMVKTTQQIFSDTRLRLEEMCTNYLESLTEIFSFMGIDPLASRRVVVGFLFEN
jgi:3-methyladenine DNA glycosylase Tag